ncbi:molybdenum cofactor guanylyltransferase [Flagellimonas crocea]|uniref:molybdenum cofactor guanylyltransferase n=1 Tax=Flagellimonas crocea TaxID=3067311 RepID=UPI00296FBC9E|nr:NTP transferase domain-containing protein [Muricauda sp. DH64]
MKPEPKTSARNASRLFGLVLSGGSSTRMGEDKGLLEYHGIPQREHLYHLLGKVCDNVFLSIQKEQLAHVPDGFKTILDQDVHKGPFNGILSAFDAYDDVAWLVLACDLPFMTQDVLEQLIRNRCLGKDATAFASPETGKPEPLACIWELQGLKKALAYTQNTNGRSPIKFLMEADIQLVNAENDLALFNANSETDYTFVKNKLME